RNERVRVSPPLRQTVAKLCDSGKGVGELASDIRVDLDVGVETREGKVGATYDQRVRVAPREQIDLRVEQRLIVADNSEVNPILLHEPSDGVRMCSVEGDSYRGMDLSTELAKIAVRQLVGGVST